MSIGPFLVSLSFGMWWLFLESKRQQEEQELNQLYEAELAYLKAEARREQELWKKQLSVRQAKARQRYEKELADWQKVVAAIQAEARRQRELWENQLALQQAQARQRYEEELARWNNAVAAMQAEAQRRQKAVLEARQRFAEAELNWASAATRLVTEFDRKKADLQKFRERHKELAAEYALARQRLYASAREIQLSQFLQKYFISDHKIPKIGPGRTAVLASYGIETAFDIVEYQILQVPGFGPDLTTRLVQWRKTVEAHFVFNASAGIPPQEQQVLDAKYGQARQLIEAALLSGESEIKGIAAKAETQLRQLYEQIRLSLGHVIQANADLSVIPPGL